MVTEHSGLRVWLRTYCLLALTSLAWACEEIVTPKQFIVDLTISGTVRSENGAPIPNATVLLGKGGYFSLPTTLESVHADASGVYHLIHHFIYYDYCPPPWLVGQAAGFQTSSMEDSRHSPECIATPQVIDITLKPSP
jgi:hypothetical protein